MPRKLSPAAARRMASARKVHGGPPRVMIPCGWCGQQFSAREMRRHFVLCPKRPKVKP